MGARGPKPAPTALKVLRGDRPSRINRGEPVPGEGDVVRPGWLAGVSGARAVWDRLAPDLQRRGVLTAWDVDAFAAFCVAVVRHRAAVELVERDGLMIDGARGGRVRNPAVQMERDYADQVKSGAARFGLTPADRSSVKAAPAAPADPRGAERFLS